jgi:hypothetical protein
VSDARPPLNRPTLVDKAVEEGRSTVADDSRATAADSSRATVVDPLPTGDRTTLDDASEPAPSTKEEPQRNTVTDLPTEAQAPESATRTETETAPQAEAETEETSTETATEAETKPKKPRATIYFVVGGLLFLAMAGPLIAYFLVFRYQPTAVKHVPAGTNMAVRIDAKELYLYKPFRDNVLSVLNDAPGVKSRGDRLKNLTGIDLRSDLREIVIASPDGQRFVVLVGGFFHEARFNRADVVKGLGKFLTEEGVTGLSLKNGVLLAPGGIEVTEADDSTIVVANDDDLLKASLQPSEEWTNLGLAGTGAMSFTIQTSALDHMRASLSAFDDSVVLSHTDRVTGSLKLGASPELSMELVPRTVTPEALSKEAETALADVKFVELLLPDEMGEHAALASAKTKPRVASVMVTASWPPAGLEAGMKRLGQALEGVLSKKAP